MDYKIIEVHQTYENGKLTEIAVVWESNEAGWIRANYATSKPCQGYKFLRPNESVSDKLIQEVAGFGMDLPPVKRKKYFPGDRKWEE